MALPKKNRLSNRNILSELFRQKPAVRDGTFTFRVQRQASGQQCAVVVSSKVAPKAVLRNYLRRRIHAALVRVLSNTVSGWRGVLTLQRVPPTDAGTLEKSLLELFTKSGIVPQ